jgi:hypothetical protein
MGLNDSLSEEFFLGQDVCWGDWEYYQVEKVIILWTSPKFFQAPIESCH